MSGSQCTETISLTQSQLALDARVDHQEVSCRLCGVKYHPQRGESLCRECLRTAANENQRIRKADRLDSKQNTAVCIQCGKSFPASVGAGRPRILCSEQCRLERKQQYHRFRQSGLRRLKPRVCPLCGETWEPVCGEGLVGNNCRKCRDESRHCMKRCVVCGELYSLGQTDKHGVGNRKTCSDECSKSLAASRAKSERVRSVRSWQSNRKRDGIECKTSRIGSMAESLFDAFCHRKGWQVSSLIGSTAATVIDRIIIRADVPERVQVKGRGESKLDANNRHYTNLKGRCGPYPTDAPVDMFAIVDTITGDIWFIPSSSLAGVRRWKPGPSWDCYKTHVLWDCNLQ